MKKIIISVTLIFLILKVFAISIPHKLYEIVNFSEFCFYGEVISISENDFKFQIEKSYFGEYPKQVISIVDHKYHELNVRWKPEIGGKMIIFLGKSNEFGYPFDFDNTLFLGSENEFYIKNDSIINLSFQISPIKIVSVDEFLKGVIDYKKNEFKIKDLLDRKFHEFRLQNFSEENFNISLQDVYLNDFIKKSYVHDFILRHLVEHYQLLLSISKNGLCHYNFSYLFEHPIFIFKENSFKLQENRNHFYDIYGIINDSLTFASKNVSIQRKDNILIIKPKHFRDCKLYIIHSYKGLIDTVQTVEFKVLLSSMKTINLRESIINGLSSYRAYFWVTSNNGKHVLYNYELVSYKLIIWKNGIRYIYNSNSRFLPKEEVRKLIFSMKKGDFIEMVDIKVVDMFGNLIKIKPVKYKFDAKDQLEIYNK